MSRAPAGEWTPQERLFVKGIGEGMKPTEAARAAGYSDPAGEIDRLMARKHIQHAVFKALLKFNSNANIYWAGLVEDAKRILHVAMRMGDIDAAMKAAGKVLDTAAKMGDTPLAEKADKEDEASDRQALAEAINASARDDLNQAAIPMLPTNEREH